MSPSQSSTSSMKCSKETAVSTASGDYTIKKPSNFPDEPNIHVISSNEKALYQTHGQTATHKHETTPVLPSLVSTTNKPVLLEAQDEKLRKIDYETHDVIPLVSIKILESVGPIRAEGQTAAVAPSTSLKRLFQRPHALRYPPTIGKVYYMPNGRSFPSSIIHRQQQNPGFFNHPVLITGIEGGIAHFYALTRAPPLAIGQLSMCLRIGATSTDAGMSVLKLASGSAPMRKETWVNLERRFSIEWRNLEIWAGDVAIDPGDLWKLWGRVAELEADQNRYIYKPLPRDMTSLHPGTIVLMPNEAGASTLGAPVLVVENLYPRFRFLRVKIFEENIYFNPATKRKHVQPRHMCLEISTQPKMGHDGTPVMLLEPESPDMRQPSYVEVFPQARTGNLKECQTWCWPPVLIRQQSMLILHHYMAMAASPKEALSLSLPAAVDPYSASSLCTPKQVLPSSVGWGPGLHPHFPLYITPNGPFMGDYHFADADDTYRATWNSPPYSSWTSLY